MAPSPASSHAFVRPNAGRIRRSAAAALAGLTAVALLSACSYGSKAADSGSGGSADTAAATGASGAKLSSPTVKIGYFANLTHGTALVGLQEGILQKELGATQIKTQVFNAGPAEIEALNAGSIDIGWIGPSPAINGYTKSDGKSLKIIGGSASGGVKLVVNPEKISSLDDLRGKKIATPQLGNTQDVALLNYLAGKGFKVDAASGAGDVSVVRTDNKVTPDAYRQGSVDGAWVPEPTASKLVTLGAKVLLNEKDVWPDKKFVITNLIVSQKFLKEHPDVVEAVLRGSVNTNAFIKANPEKAKADANEAIKKEAGNALEPAVLDPAWADIDFLDDPLAGTLQAEADHAVTAGLLKKPNLNGIYDLTLLNKVLAAKGQAPVADAGLGAK
ncbi:aliphatic sulfonate ABC transporter substrate-binding protein [Kitasatospora aureofaciens]|uniref:Lipoprotein n=1 Tax=Kitasatospora aureofaciens TaxID=1894 RepID=A0A1E7N4V2_KITAU|nr:aliphatic sulfonate ABC transporter substrate-binding protein [Kitasatospora aureofaciens]ARF80882.1 sulfate ABC transporter substrate-binding protein [Kitasatospora aureofaciens]OEV35684.1 sulfate ABC transporter substrate-binding protein [Kitasatospora aureofaciens]GGU62801.1 lipoprotein [Kitasatospora aureofaciens]